MTWLAAAGAACTFGALVMATVWMLAAYAIVQSNIERALDAERLSDIREAEFDDLVKQMGPGPNGS